MPKADQDLHFKIAAVRVTTVNAIADQQWQRDFLPIAEEARDAGVEAAALDAVAQNRRRDVRAAIRLGAIITERLAPPLLATLLVVTRRSAYARERSKDVSTLLRETRDAGLGDLVEGITPLRRGRQALGVAA